MWLKNNDRMINLNCVKEISIKRGDGRIIIIYINGQLEPLRSVPREEIDRYYDYIVNAINNGKNICEVPCNQKAEDFPAF